MGYRIPPYDLEAMMIEADLLVDWYAPHIVGVLLASGARAQYVNHLAQVFWRRSLAERRTWTLRDVHSPNVLWLAEREGVKRIGLLDFQDCVLGQPAYDLVSLLQDARVTVSNELEMKLLGHYARQRASNLKRISIWRLSPAPTP